MTGRNSKKLVVTVYKSQQVRLVCLIAIIVTNSITTIVERVGAEELLLLRMMGGKMTKLVRCCINIFLFLFLQIAAYASVSNEILVRKINLFGGILLFLSLSILNGCTQQKDSDPETNLTFHSHKTTKRPNILLIVADDLAYTDIGIYGGEINTPNLNQLAKDGVTFSQFYTAPVCSPARAMLLSGIDNHLAGLGNMSEILEPDQRGKKGYEGFLNFDIVSIATLLKDAGYQTYMAGKWHLGLAPEQDPSQRGFEHTYALLQGYGGHFNDMGGAWSGGKALYRENGKDVSLPKDFYSTKFYTEKMIENIENGIGNDKPFFAYLAYTAPHWPLQAPHDAIEKQKGKYDEGYDVLHQRRLAGLRKSGLFAKNLASSKRPPGLPYWDELSPEKKRIESRKMEVYAAMVSGIDLYVGRLIDFLESIGEMENTFILFMSDNGAEGADVDKYQRIYDYIRQCCDNSYQNMGAADSFIWYGAGWAWASTPAFRLFKGFTTEGGIRVPAFVHYPRLKSKGITNSEFLTVKDVMPTLLDLAETQHPGTQYKGRQVLPLQRHSILPMLQGKEPAIHTDEQIMGWEMFGYKAMRKGNWKIVNLPSPYGTCSWELFDLLTDPAEQHDLSSTHPGIANELQKLWVDYKDQNGIIVSETVASQCNPGRNPQVGPAPDL